MISPKLGLLLLASVILLIFLYPRRAQTSDVGSSKIDPPQMPPAENVPAPEYRDLYSDTWVATDALGRTLPVGGQVRAPQPDKTAAIFYYLWQQNGAEVHDISKALLANPKNPKLGGPTSFHWWGEPEAGYFNASDPWVIRRNLSMLNDAGIDVLFFDATNALIYLDTVKVIGDVSRQMRAEGTKTPEFAFMTNARGGFTQTELYEKFYSQNLYPELWYRLDGKPFLLGAGDAKMDDGSQMSAEVKNFFSRRQSWAWSNANGWYGDGKGKWPWLDNTPQQPGYSPAGKLEQIVVGTAQHPTSNQGKSFHGGKQPPVNEYGITQETSLGLHFAEQWKRALEVDPPLILITQWNEWIAQRFVVKPKQHANMMGHALKPGESFFVDVYNAEYNRDIEPMKGGWSDDYYYQMVAGLRRFKGVRPLPVATMAIARDDADWSTIGPEYRDTIGDTIHRDFRGWTKNLIYKNDSGRNDIVSAKVARDAENCYFHVEAQEKLTPRSDPNWMMLFIDADNNPQSGWHGYDVRLIDGNIEVWSGDQWVRKGVAKTVVSEKSLDLELPRSFITSVGSDLIFDFKWVDNANPDVIEDWFVNGDTAPNRRFNYRYLVKR